MTYLERVLFCVAFFWLVYFLWRWFYLRYRHRRPVARITDSRLTSDGMWELDVEIRDCKTRQRIERGELVGMSTVGKSRARIAGHLLYTPSVEEDSDA